MVVEAKLMSASSGPLSATQVCDQELLGGSFLTVGRSPRRELATQLPPDSKAVECSNAGGEHVFEYL